MSEQLTAPSVVLACVDGSETGYKAADFAIALASRLQSRLIFLNIVGATASEKEYNITADMVGSFEVLGMEALTKCREKAASIGVQSEILQGAGDPGDEILKHAKRLDCDLIVIGKMGLGKAEKLFLGSVSQKIVNGSAVPVVLVK